MKFNSGFRSLKLCFSFSAPPWRADRTSPGDRSNKLQGLLFAVCVVSGLVLRLVFGGSRGHLYWSSDLHFEKLRFRLLAREDLRTAASNCRLPAWLGFHLFPFVSPILTTNHEFEFRSHRS